MIDKHLKFIKQSADKKVKVLCLQEIFYGPYFAAEQNPRWYQLSEKAPQGPTTTLMRQVAKKHRMVIIACIFEEEQTGEYYNTAVVIDADGKYLGKYRKNHIPHCYPGFWEKYYFRPGNLGYPVFQTKFATIGITLCYDRHFVEGPRILGLKGARIVFNPNATVSGLSEHIWKLEMSAIAAFNQYFVGAVNRVGREYWNTGEFYGTSYFADPRGKIIAMASRTKDEVLIADLDLDLIREVRDNWQFYRDRRPETYGEILK
ncbi:MAG: nitrilase-related carbon-nitrogen hydrolase [Planctomycetota bacterium]|nr:nitrilase-related carbon-nitrogen hydrolase [Planctomycetota bacterium]